MNCPLFSQPDQGTTAATWLQRKQDFPVFVLIRRKTAQDIKTTQISSGAAVPGVPTAQLLLSLLAFGIASDWQWDARIVLVCFSNILSGAQEISRTTQRPFHS